MTPEAVAWAWQELLARAGVRETDRRPALSYGPLRIPGDGVEVRIDPSPDGGWRELVDRAPGTLPWTRGDDRLPLLFLTGDPDFRTEPTGGLSTGVDLLATCLFMLTRWEETLPGPTDEFGRFPASRSVAYRQGFLDRPIVDEWAMVLRRGLQRACPEWTPASSSFTVAVSHDVDFLRCSRGGASAVRRLGAALLKHGSPRAAWWHLRGMLRQRRGGLEASPHYRAVVELVDEARRHGLGGPVYLMTTGPGPRNADYSVEEPEVRRLIDDLRARGVEIGLHPGFETPDDPERLRAEKATLEAAIGTPSFGSRQHCLRFSVPATWRHAAAAGLTHDATMGYADHEGFRCGTCHPFRPFDLEQDRRLEVWERPLVVMDVTLARYRRLTPDQGAERILSLARACRSVGGAFTLLWHNTSLEGEWRDWGRAYRALLPRLAELRIDSPPL